MVSADKIPLKEFDEEACLRYMEQTERIIDLQLSIPWAVGEFLRIVDIPMPPDIRYFVRLKQMYETGKWLVGDPCMNMVTGGCAATFTRMPEPLPLH